MAKAKPNPFAVLGCAPDLIREFEKEPGKVDILVKSQYRVLSQIHHPDRAGDPERFKEIQEAYDTLSEDFERDFWLRLFIRNRKDQVAELKQQFATADRSANKALEALTNFWKAFVLGGPAVEHPTMTIGMKLSDLSDGTLEAFSVFEPPALSVIMQDRAETMLTHSAAKGAGNRPSWNIGDSFELRITTDGRIYRQNHRKTHFNPTRDDMPAVSKHLVELRTSPVHKSYYWQNEGEPEHLDMKLIGSIEKRCFEEKEMREKFNIAGLIPTDARAADFEKIQHGFSLHEFSPYLRFVSPNVRVCQYVIGARINPLRFCILGYARKIYFEDNQRSDGSSTE